MSLTDLCNSLLILLEANTQICTVEWIKSSCIVGNVSARIWQGRRMSAIKEIPVHREQQCCASVMLNRKSDLLSACKQTDVVVQTQELNGGKNECSKSCIYSDGPTCWKLSLSKPWSSGWASSRIFLPSKSCDRQQVKQLSLAQETLTPYRADIPTSCCAYLWLVADSGHAAVVYKGEHALAVMAWDELHWNTDAVDVCVAWATSHLKKKGFFCINIMHWKRYIQANTMMFNGSEHRWEK